MVMLSLLKIIPGLVVNGEIQITAVHPPPVMVNSHILVAKRPQDKVGVGSTSARLAMCDDAAVGGNLFICRSQLRERQHPVGLRVEGLGNVYVYRIRDVPAT